MFTMAVSRVWSCHDCPSVFAVDSLRAARRESRGHIRAGARLSPFRSIARRSRRRRRRDDHVAGRSVAAGAARAGGRVRHSAEGAAGRGACARQRSAGDRDGDPRAVAATAGSTISSTWWPRRSRRRRRPLPAAPCCRARWPRRSPKSAPRRRVSRSWKIPTPISRNSRSTALSSGSAIWRRSANPCSRATICRWRPARRCSASCRRRSPASSAGRQWMGPEHAEYAAREACEKATVALAADTPYEEVGQLGGSICARAGNSPPA